MTLDVRETASEAIFKATLDGSDAAGRDGVAPLRKVWQAATASRRRRTVADRLPPVVESLRSAIAQSAH